MDGSSLQRAIDDITWYHDFDFGNGLRATSHLHNADEVRAIWRFIEQQLDAIDFRGKSVLEIGTWDGYWSFYAERRGAARVVATDDLSQNWAAGDGVRLARQLYGSHIEIRQDVSVYDLAGLGETFDIILCLGVFYHLHDPLYAFTQLRHRCHEDSLVVLEGSAASGGLRHNEVRYFHSPWLEFLPSSSGLHALLKAAYLGVTSQAWLDPRSAAMPEDGPLVVDRALVVCEPFTGINDVYQYRPLLGLHAYDPRFSDGLGARVEIVEAPPVVPPGQEFNATLRIVNSGSSAWTAVPPPEAYRAMFLGAPIGSGGDEPAGVQQYRQYLETNGLQGRVAVGVHLSRDAGGGTLQRDYARGFLPSDVPPRQQCDVTVSMRAPETPGIYALTFDLVDEYVTWFEQLGSPVAVEYVVVGVGAVPPDSRAPGVLRAEFVEVEWPGAGVAVVSIRNSGDTAWLKGPLARGGHVQLAVQRLDATGLVQDRDWMRVGLPHTVAPGDSVVVRVDVAGVAAHADTVQLKLDLVAELRSWFEDAGSRPLVIDVSSVR